jgi:hypothetical protein
MPCDSQALKNVALTQRFLDDKAMHSTRRLAARHPLESHVSTHDFLDDKAMRSVENWQVREQDKPAPGR